MASTPIEENVYDYVICGGGTSGCVVAGRLAEDRSASILVIEAGPHSETLPYINVPGGGGAMFGGAADWNIESVPSPALNNRSIPLTRGKFLGGSSGLNGTVCIRGMKQDFDDWEMEGWSGEEFFKYMSKAETYVPKPWFKANEQVHGTTGPIRMAVADPAPISKLLLESYQSKGLPLVPDMFSTGETPNGCGYAVRSVVNGVRTTAADYISKNNTRENVTIKTSTLVNKVVIETKGGVPQATGVEVVSQDGTQSEFKARKEVVISAGAYCSPAILLRSGIGPKEEVEKHDIPSLIDLPGVGKNLLDHMIVWTFYEVNQPKLTNDYLLTHNGMQAEAVKAWSKDQSGVMANFPFGAFAFSRLDDRLADCELWNSAPRLPGRDPMGLTAKQPHVEFFNTDAYGGPQAKFPVTNGESAFAMISQLFAPHARGTVVLKSKDPSDSPIVDHDYLNDPLDVLVLAEACALANEIVLLGSGTKEVVKNTWPKEPALNEYKSREDWIPYVREMATTCYHPAGTCKMGKLEEDPHAVVDAELRVYGVNNLRVVDVSIMPKLHSGHTQMPAYGIGEKAADLIKAAA